jgi:hypothetical protein
LNQRAVSEVRDTGQETQELQKLQCQQLNLLIQSSNRGSETKINSIPCER